MTAIQGLLDRLENHYDFQCEGGPLRNCVEWQQLRAALPALPPVRERTIEECARVAESMFVPEDVQAVSFLGRRMRDDPAAQNTARMCAEFTAAAIRALRSRKAGG